MSPTGAPGVPGPRGDGFRQAPAFPEAASRALRDTQLRANLRRATGTIRDKRDRVMAELGDLEQLRDAAAAIKDESLSRLGELLSQVEERVGAAGGRVHYAATSAEARAIVVDLVSRTGSTDVVKVKSMTTAEIELNEALATAGVEVVETDLAELIVQLGDDLPSHIVVPALHRNRAEVREIFVRRMGERGLAAPAGLGDDPAELAAAARAHLRRRFLDAKVAISGANFVVAESGSVVVVESEGNGRMCLTLPHTLISVAGIDKVVPRFRDLEVFLQLLARSATGERMSPYTSVWTGATPGNGPSEFHLVLVDNGRTRALADPIGRQALRCIRCAACLNVCPVYERVGGRAYGSVYPGPIGAVLTPQLDGVASGRVEATLPFASTLCGACAEVCPVRIDIPRLLVHLRGRAVDEHRGAHPEPVAMVAAAYTMSSPRRFGRAVKLGGLVGKVLGRGRALAGLPGPAGRWASGRDLPQVGAQSFRDWWASERGGRSGTAPLPVAEPLQRGRGAGGPDGARTASGAVQLRQALAWLRPTMQQRAPGVARQVVLEGRDGVMGAISSALVSAPFVPVEVPRHYTHDAGAVAGELLALFVERVAEYRATARVVGGGDVGAAVAEALERTGSRRVIVPSDLPEAWLPPRATATAPAAVQQPPNGGVVFEVVVDDPGLGATELDGFDAAVSGCAVAIAATGTVVLDSGPAQGRRALSLVPDHLVLVVRQDQLVGGVPEAVARLVPTAAQTWVSGPSATSDIELQRVEGVHGPRVLDVLVLVGSGPGH